MFRRNFPSYLSLAEKQLILRFIRKYDLAEWYDRKIDKNLLFPRLSGKRSRFTLSTDLEMLLIRLTLAVFLLCIIYIHFICYTSDIVCNGGMGLLVVE